MVPYTEDGLRLSERLRSVARELERVTIHPHYIQNRGYPLPTHQHYHYHYNTYTIERNLASGQFGQVGQVGQDGQDGQDGRGGLVTSYS